MIVIKWGGGGSHSHSHWGWWNWIYLTNLFTSLFMAQSSQSPHVHFSQFTSNDLCLLRLGGLSINLLYNLFWSTVRIFSSQRGRKLQLEYWFDEGQPHHWKKLKLSLLPDFLQHIQSEANIRGTWEQKIFYCYGPNQYKLYEIFVKTKIMSVRDPWRMEYPISPVVSSLRYMPHDST